MKKVFSLVSLLTLGGMLFAPQSGMASDSPIQQCAPAPPANYGAATIDGEEAVLGRYPAGQFGGSLVRSIIGSDPKTFNYWVSNDTGSRELCGLMFAPLLNTDAYTGAVTPALAASYKIAPDKVTYTTTLRKGLKWSDGHPITAEDVAYTWNTIIKEGYGNSSMRDVTTVDGKSPVVTVVDKYTNKFVTPRPFAPFERSLGMPIAPKHIFEPITKGKDSRKVFDTFWNINTKPESFVTSGPFTLERFVPGQRVQFKPTKNYYMFNSDKKRLPYLGHITYLIVADVNTNLLKFKGKEVDITTVRCRDAGDLVKDAAKLNFKLYDFGPSEGSTFLTFNMNRRKNPKTGKLYVDPIKSAWFNDTNFRQAINHVLDRKSIVDNYFKGLGTPAFGGMSPTSPFVNKNLKPFASDVKLAKELLAKSGFKYDKDGNLQDKDGHRVEFDMLMGAGGSFLPHVAQTLQDNLKSIGIKLNYQELNFNLLIDRVNNTLDWQAILFGLGGGDPLEPNESSNVYRSGGRLHLFDQRLPDDKGAINVTDARPWEKQIDALLDKGTSVFDRAQRKKIYDEIQEILYRESPMIYVASPKTIVAARNTIHNFSPTPFSQLPQGLHNIEEIWVK